MGVVVKNLPTTRLLDKSAHNESGSGSEQSESEHIECGSDSGHVDENETGYEYTEWVGHFPCVWPTVLRQVDFPVQKTVY